MHRNSYPNFLTVSRVDPPKGVDVAIDALARVLRNFPDATLRVVGRSSVEETEEYLRKKVLHSGLDKNVVFCGPLPPEKVAEEMRRADVFLQHSLNINGWVEGFGVSIAEAAAIGLPVVVSDAGGIPDQVADGVTGYIVAQGDVAKMAERMEYLASNLHLARSMGQAGRRNVAAHFDTQGQIAKLKGVLRRVVESREGNS